MGNSKRDSNAGPAAGRRSCVRSALAHVRPASGRTRAASRRPAQPKEPTTMGEETIALNRKARHEFHDRGDVRGRHRPDRHRDQVDPGRPGQPGQEAYARIERGEAWLVGAHIAAVRGRQPLEPRAEADAQAPPPPDQIDELLGKTKAKGLTLVPLRLYIDERGPRQGRDRARPRQAAPRPPPRHRRAGRAARHRRDDGRRGAGPLGPPPRGGAGEAVGRATQARPGSGGSCPHPSPQLSMHGCIPIAAARGPVRSPPVWVPSRVPARSRGRMASVGRPRPARTGRWAAPIGGDAWSRRGPAAREREPRMPLRPR